MTVKLERDFHVVKGIQYKQGLVPAMLISTQHKQQWLDSEASQAATEVVGARSPPAAARAPATTDSSPKPAAAAAVGSASPAAAPATTRASGAASPAVKKGFLNSAKTSIYPETVKFKGSAAAANAAKSTADILLPSSAAADPPQAEAPAAAAPAQQKKKATGIQDLGEVKSAPREDPPRDSDSAVKDREKEKPKPIAAGADMRAVSSSVRRKDTAPSLPPSVPEASTPSQRTAEAPTSSSKAPSYTVKERGHVSMGDLEPLREKICSSRLVVYPCSPSLFLPPVIAIALPALGPARSSTRSTCHW